MKAKLLRPLVLFGFLVLLAGCVTGTLQPTNLIPEPEPDTGLVYFYREKRFSGGAVSYNIKEGDKVLGPIKNGTYFFVHAEPGVHTYTASTEETKSRTLTVEAGKTYYIECGVDVGFFVGQPVLKIVTADEAKAVIPGLKYMTK